LEVRVRAADSKAVLGELVGRYKEDGIGFKEEETMIGEVPGSKIITSICRADNCLITEWFVLKNNYLYQISSIYPDFAYDERFDQIISTIKFSESTE
jgi:hypothetical protein